MADIPFTPLAGGPDQAQPTQPAQPTIAAQPTTVDVQAPVTPGPSAPLSANIAQNTLQANRQNPGNWAQNIVAGVTSALAGFSSPKEAPIGAGYLSGIGQAAQGMLAQRQKNIENQREQQKLDTQQQNQDREYQLKVAENARQQAQSIREQSDHDLRMKAFRTEQTSREFNLMKDEADFRQSQLDKEDALRRIGAKPFQIAGQDAPAFDDLGQAEDFANKNGLANSTHENDHRTRIVLGGDMKYHLYDVPDEGMKEYTLKDPSGKEVKIFTDPLGALNYQEKVSQIRHSSAESNELDAKAAMERLDAGTGTPTDAIIAAGAASKAVLADPNIADIPRDVDGNIDKTSDQYKALPADSKSRIDTAEKAFKQVQDSGGMEQSIPYAIATHNMDPSQLTKRGKDYNAKLQQVNAISIARTGKPFDIAQASIDYNTAKAPAIQQVLKRTHSVLDPNGILDQASAAAAKLPQTALPDPVAAWPSDH
ncbi:MAG TPA: hypothetical protein VNY51_13365 [Candidatus Dormibacteraeota bacterium]|jgi:hypothetical protein|nr:hypothetical protein [Candidatus Dormibacteraeota bacterium]